MSQMHPALDAALTERQATIFGAVELRLPARTVRLLDGAGSVSLDGQVFTGRDDQFGILSAIEDLTDGAGDQAPGISITLLPSTDVAAVTLANPAMQGAPVLVYLGAVDQITGAVIGEPLLIFNGLLDSATLKIGQTSRVLEYEVTSVFEDFFFSDDGSRLSDTFHQYLWPGEMGCAHVTYVTNQVYWGLASPDGVNRSKGSAAAAVGAVFR